MKTQVLDKLVKNYLIECMSSEAATVEGKIEETKASFIAEMGWNVDQVGEQRALENWLQGLCGAVSVEFWNNEILLMAIRWGSLSENHTEPQGRKILDNYWRLLSAKLGQLFRGHHLPQK